MIVGTVALSALFRGVGRTTFVLHLATPLGAL
jgi:hypothetical protein